MESGYQREGKSGYQSESENLCQRLPCPLLLLRLKVESESGKYISRESESETFASVSLAPSPDTRGRLATIRPEGHDYIHTFMAMIILFMDTLVKNDQGLSRWVILAETAKITETPRLQKVGREFMKLVNLVKLVKLVRLFETIVLKLVADDQGWRR